MQRGFNLKSEYGHNEEQKCRYLGVECIRIMRDDNDDGYRREGDAGFDVICRTR